jgi:isoleucyl-tRNA synthetase
VLTHGFTLDGKGRKMSKSMGNVIAPQEIMKKSGAEILRLWVAAEDFREDVRISDEILNRLVEAYRRLRNTARFLISNLYDFDPATDSVAVDELDEQDGWILHRTQNVLARCREAYENYEFHAVYHTLNNFCSVDLSAHYLDIVKDRLYCEGANSKKRRAAQTALYKILDVLVHLMAPVVSFTAEEVWGYMPNRKHLPASVFLSPIPVVDAALDNRPLADKWERLFIERAEVLKALEGARAGGIIGHSLDAEVILFSGDRPEESALAQLARHGDQRAADVLIVSQFNLQKDTAPSSEAYLAGGPVQDGARAGWVYRSELLRGAIAVFKARGDKCERCWKYDPEVGKDSTHPTVCPRCAQVLNTGVSA